MTTDAPVTLACLACGCSLTQDVADLAAASRAVASERSGLQLQLQQLGEAVLALGSGGVASFVLEGVLGELQVGLGQGMVWARSGDESGGPLMFFARKRTLGMLWSTCRCPTPKTASDGWKCPKRREADTGVESPCRVQGGELWLLEGVRPTAVLQTSRTALRLVRGGSTGHTCRPITSSFS